MATTAQLEKWAAEVLALVDKGVDDVDDLIAKRRARMSTLMALNALCAAGRLIRSGNHVWRPLQHPAGPLSVKAVSAVTLPAIPPRPREPQV